jgi:CheY-like chemotaxis protein
VSVAPTRSEFREELTVDVVPTHTSGALMSVVALGQKQAGGHLALYRQPHVLVAHGEASVRKGLVGILGRAGYDVDDVGNFDQALAVLDEAEVDALVVSFGLPVGGCRLLLDACEALPPTVVLSASTDDVAAVSANSHVQSVLTRPFSLQALCHAVAMATSGLSEPCVGNPDEGHEYERPGNGDWP